MKETKLQNNNTQSNGVTVIQEYVSRLPDNAGVYRMINRHGDVMYVGKAKNLKKRVSSYTRPDKLPLRLQRMIHATTSMEFITTKTEAEALLLEANLIKRLKPPCNILLRDDKSSPYIFLSGNHDFPRMEKHRGTRREKGDYFGPFAAAKDVNQTLHALQKAFRIRNCSDSMFASRKRPCLQYHIKRCTAPCVGKVSPNEYAEQIRQAKDFLSGKSSDVQSQLAEQMYQASENRDYEKAAEYRDKIASLTAIQAAQDINAENLVTDADVIALYTAGGQSCIQVFFFRNGRNYGNIAHFPKHDKAEDNEAEIMAQFMAQFYTSHTPPAEILVSHMPEDKSVLVDALASIRDGKIDLSHPQRGGKVKLITHALDNAKDAHERKMAQTAKQREIFEQIATVFDLPEPPNRIEVYDNSHLSGTGMVGAMIVATPDGFDKKSYRKFNIKTVKSAGDDYAMMREVISRRFKNGAEAGATTTPDLLLIDGGQGQLSSVLEIMDNLNLSHIPVVAISKGPDRNAGKELYHQRNKEPFQLPYQSPIAFYMQNIRDVSHRFVIGTQRDKRKQDMTTNPLDNIAGIGAKRKKALLSHFGSAKAVGDARLEDLLKVDGISKAIAEEILAYFGR